MEEDDMIRNEIIAFVEQAIHRGGGTLISQEQEDRWIAWLEKQGEQKTTEEITSNLDYISPKDKVLFEIATVLSQHEDKDGSPLEEIRSILINYEINNLKSNEQKPVFEMITPEESLGIDSETYNKILDECIYGEQKPTDKVEPKFKQGDIIKEKETGNLFYVNSVEDFGYTLHYKDCIAKGCTMDFKYEDNYELVEQTPT